MIRRLLLSLCFACAARAEEIILRVGYFPNITHAQGVIGSETTREGRGWFEQRLGPGVRVRWYAFNAGPSAMEAIFAGSIDLSYVGPNPALNAYIRSGGAEVRLLAGAAEGGAALVVPGNGRIARPADFRGKRLATPQLGNTQDVAARTWLRKQGFRVTLTGGDVLVVPTANADQLAMFQRGDVDAVWTVEPWVSRLESEAGGRVMLEQRDSVTTILVAAVRLLRERPLLAGRFLRAHRELTAWVAAHPGQAQALVRAGLAADTRRDLPAGPGGRAPGGACGSPTAPPSPNSTTGRGCAGRGFLRDAIPLGRLFSGKP